MEELISFIITVYKKYNNDFSENTEFFYKSPKIIYKRGCFYATDYINSGEKLLESENLWNSYTRKDYFEGKKIILLGTKGNAEFFDEKTAYAIGFIERGKKIIFSTPKWYSPGGVTMYNRLLFNLIQFFIVMLFLIGFILLLIRLTSHYII